jgi:hypothetical protein
MAVPLTPGQIPYLILRVTGFDSASGPIPGNGQHYHYGRGSGIGGERAYVGLGSRGTREPHKIDCVICVMYKNGVVLEDTMKSLKGLTYLY